jgi:hypothetical protein
MSFDVRLLALSTGAINVACAAGPQLIISVVSTNNVAIQVDANGDNSFEKSIASTISELRALL